MAIIFGLANNSSRFPLEEVSEAYQETDLKLIILELRSQALNGIWQPFIQLFAQHPMNIFSNSSCPSSVLTNMFPHLRIQLRP